MNNNLNGILVASIAALATVGGTFATVSAANAAPATEQSMSVGSGAVDASTSKAIRQSDGSNFSVRRSFEWSDQQRASIDQMKSENSGRMASIQSLVRDNQALLKSLAKKNVDVRSIVDIQTSANGGLIIYES